MGSLTMIKHYLLIVFLLFFSAIGFGQQSNEIVGHVIDEKTKIPIVFATIKIKDQQNGVIADDNGYFRIPLRYKTQNFSILISSIGYETREVALSSFKTSVTTITLKPQVETLNEVVVTANNGAGASQSAKAIVKTAIQRIATNYPREPFSYVGYYRDYQVLNTNYINFNEGIIEAFDAGFHTDKLQDTFNQTVLYEYKENKDFENDPTIAAAYDNKNKHKYIEGASISPLGGNELSILSLHDPIRNYNKPTFSFIDTFNENFIYNHEFTMSRTLFLNNTHIYEITFKAKQDITGVKNHAKGTIYIARNSYAIHKLEYDGFISGEFKPFYSLKLEYVPIGKHMFLNYISFNNLFQVKNRKDFKIENIAFDISENSFFLTFNNPVSKSSIEDKKNYRILYKKKKLLIDKASMMEPTVLKLKLVPGAIANPEEFQGEVADRIKYRIKNIKDITGRPINKTTTIYLHQFREIFVQEVHPNKSLPLELTFINKNAPLSASELNTLEESSKYWISSPFEASKN